MSSNESSPDILKFFESGKPLRYSKGSIIINGHDEPEGVYCIARGFVKIYSISNDGEEYIHIVYKAGEVFPLIWALKDVKRKVFYESLGDSVLWRMPRDEFIMLTKNDLRMAALVTDQLAEQFRIYADRVDNLEYKRSRERLVYRLLFMASRFGTKHGNTVEFDDIFTQQLIAGTINMARESVTREFEKLQAKGLVAYRNRRIIITDLVGLSNEMSDPVDADLWGLLPDLQH
jgi:CRP-like cAMP-binding protein